MAEAKSKRCGTIGGYATDRCRCDRCRRAGSEYQARSRELKRNHVERVCVRCSSAFMARKDNVKAGHGKFCSPRCRNQANNEARGFSPRPPRKSELRKRAERLAEKAAAGSSGGNQVFVQGACIVCDDQFLSPGMFSRYCSKACRVRNRSNKSYGLSWLDRMALFARDDWVCQICMEPVDYSADPSSDWYPTLDHIVPQSKGGSHDVGNLRTAHRWCNSVRGDLSFYSDADLAA